MEGGVQVAEKGCKMNIISDKINFLPSTNFLDVSAKLRKTMISFVLSVRQSIRPSIRSHATAEIPLDRFSCIFLFLSFSKHRGENTIFIKIGQE
jgi:hypothetical protein